MEICEECYSANNRITPLTGFRDCLETHTQYICGSCGRCICIEKEARRNLQRRHFPFQSLETASLYLRTADISEKKSCGIYHLINTKGRSSYKIFTGDDELKSYLRKNPTKQWVSDTPVFRRAYKEFPATQIRKLTADEINNYLSE